MPQARPHEVMLLLVEGAAECKVFQSNRAKIASLFLRLKQDERFSSFLDDFLFDTSRPDNPHCELLDELLAMMHVAGVIGRPNPTYSENTINVPRPPDWDGKVQSAFGEKAIDFQEMSRQFQDELCPA